jgi:hypothetical protein
MANWAKKLKRGVQQLLEGEDWGNKEKYRKMEKSGELTKTRDKLSPTVQTKKAMKSGLSPDEVSTLTGISKEQLASISENDRKELAKHFGKKK